MRSCIYCGKDLKDGEVCDCPQSVARRKSKSSQTSGSARKNDRSTDKSNPYKTETSYKTGYAQNDSKFERARNKYRAKRAAKKSSAAPNHKGFFKGLWRYVVNFLKSPAESISNPGYLGKGAVMTIAAAQGMVLWLCMFFILRGGNVGPFKFLSSMMSFGGGEGYRLVLSIILTAVSGALSGIVLFFLYSGIFYLINRFIMKLRTPYWDFCVRLAATWIPFTVICAIGAALSILSAVTLAVLVLCGAAVSAALTYEALKTEWISYSPSKVLYAMLLGFFVFFSIICRLILI